MVELILTASRTFSSLICNNGSYFMNWSYALYVKSYSEK